MHSKLDKSPGIRIAKVEKELALKNHELKIEVAVERVRPYHGYAVQ